MSSTSPLDPPYSADYHTKVISFSVVNVNFFFIPNSHGFMGKEWVTNKLETMTALHLLTPSFP